MAALPHFLTEHQPCWADWYRDEAALLGSSLPDSTHLNHVGCTAAKGKFIKRVMKSAITHLG